MMLVFIKNEPAVMEGIEKKWNVAKSKSGPRSRGIERTAQRPDWFYRNWGLKRRRRPSLHAPI
jgi:hypothetical protein